MITGDTLLTACHAAKTLGLTTKPQLILAASPRAAPAPAANANANAAAACCSTSASSSSSASSPAATAAPTLSWLLPRAEPSVGKAAAPSTKQPPTAPTFEASSASFLALARSYALCMDGVAFEALGRLGALAAALPHVAVLARMAPEQKVVASPTTPTTNPHPHPPSPPPPTPPRTP